MDYGALPPEVNSARMYAGPGVGPMLAAAAAWDALGAELQATASSYAAIVADLTTATWLGPTAVAMTAAVGPYVTWLAETAARADQAAAQAKSAASAYETAFAATVPPPIVAANRALLLTLVSTNIFGQNTPAIAATEAQYLQLWAQDAAAMYGYAGSSAAATRLAPFSEPPPINTAPVGTHQPEAAAPSAGGPVGIGGGLTWPSLGSVSLPPLLAADLTNWNTVTGVLTGPFSVQGWTSIPGGPFLAFGQLYAYAQNGQGLGSFFAPAQPITGALAPIAGSAAPHLTSVGPLGGAASGSMGRAALVGSLSVPQGWAAAVPAIRTVAVSLAGYPAAGPTAALSGEADAFGEMALSSVAGRAVGSRPGYQVGNGVLAGALGGSVATADPAAAMIFVLPALED